MVYCSHTTAGPNAWTFKIKPIAALVEAYVGDGTGWVDPFAGKNSPAEWTNDHNPEMPAKWHMDAEDFCKMMAKDKGLYGRPVRGVLFDPPYSYRQITEHYKTLGLKATQLDTSTNFYNRVMNAICDSIMVGGIAISFGWNSNGFGKNRGFIPVEYLVVGHGQHHNDTIVTVEVKTGE